MIQYEIYNLSVLYVSISYTYAINKALIVKIFSTQDDQLRNIPTQRFKWKI